MKEYMETVNANDQIIRNIESCILATRLPSHPENLLEGIICDADLYHLGTGDFYFTNMLVKREYELINNSLPENWDEHSLSLLQTHKFYTQYCRDLLDEGKLQNIQILRKK